jgi:hypothetical protein
LTELATTCTAKERPTSLAYFRQAVLDRWQARGMDADEIAALAAAIDAKFPGPA